MTSNLNYELAIAELPNLVNKICRASANDDKSKLEPLAKELQKFASDIIKHCTVLIESTEKQKLPPLTDFIGIVNGYNIPHPNKILLGNYIRLNSDIVSVDGFIIKAGTILISMVDKWVYEKAA